MERYVPVDGQPLNEGHVEDYVVGYAGVSKLVAEKKKLLEKISD